jgi:hypothetical protein
VNSGDDTGILINPSSRSVLGIDIPPYPGDTREFGPMRRFLSGLSLAILLLLFPVVARAGDWTDPYKAGAQKLTKQEEDRKLTYFVGTIAAMVAGLVGYQFRRELREMVMRRPNYQDEQF